MKLRTLTINNIASIENAEIHFDKPPLSTCEVFLITGKTGSGKSTILDSICLALYGTTPRLANNRMQGDTADHRQNITLKDARQLMRRNTGSCSCRLTFRGSNDIEYEAVWAVSRAYNKPDRKLQPKTWTLTNLDTGLTLTKDREIEAEVARAIGLDFKQFCRTTMLAQGEFTKFLNSNDNDKAEILEKITGADIYSRISSKIFEITTSRRAEYEKTAQLVSDVALLSDEAIAAKNAELAALDKESAYITARRETTAKKIEWQRQRTALERRLADARNELARATTAVESDHFRAIVATVDRWRRSADMRNSLGRREKAASALTAERDRRAELCRRFATALSARDALTHRIQAAEAELSVLNQLIDSQKERTAIYENAPEIIAQLRSMADSGNRIDQATAALEKSQRQLTSVLQPKALEAAKRHAEAASAVSEADNALCRLIKQLEQSGIDEARKDKELTLRRKADAELALERLRQLSQALEAARQLAAQLGETEATSKRLAVERGGMETAVRQAADNRAATEKALLRQRDTVDKFARQMRARLSAGDICPVCGREIAEHLPDEAELQELYQVAQTAFDEADRHHRELLNSLNAIEARLTVTKKQAEELRRAIAADRSAAEATELFAASCRTIEVDGSSADVEQAVAGMIADCEVRAKRLNITIADAERIEAEIRRHTDLAARLRAKLDAAAKLKEAAEKKHSDCFNEITLGERIIAEKREEIEKASAETARLLGADEWTDQRRQEPRRFAERLAKAAADYKSAVGRSDSMRLSITDLSNRLGILKSVIEAIVALCPDWADLSPAAGTEFGSDDAAALRSDVQEVATRIASLDTEIRDIDTAIGRFVVENPDFDRDELTRLATMPTAEIDRLTTGIESARQAVASTQAVVRDIAAQHERHLADAPDLADDTPESLAATAADLDMRYRESIRRHTEIESELRADSEARRRLGDLVARRDKAEAEFRRWSSLDTMLGEKSGGKFRKIAQSYILSSLIKAANKYLRLLTDRYELTVAPGTFVISLTDAYQGFASRSAATLSGGESFLVSLALALALSDIGIRFSVDTLFIDEGFGTLSGEPLRQAIATLRTLHSSTGRHVGIISHVAELQEQLPVQISVVRQSRYSAAKISVADSSGAFEGN